MWHVFTLNSCFLSPTFDLKKKKKKKKFLWLYDGDDLPSFFTFAHKHGSTSLSVIDQQ